MRSSNISAFVKPYRINSFSKLLFLDVAGLERGLQMEQDQPKVEQKNAEPPTTKKRSVSKGRKEGNHLLKHTNIKCKILNYLCIYNCEPV